MSEEELKKLKITARDLVCVFTDSKYSRINGIDGADQRIVVGSIVNRDEQIKKQFNEEYISKGAPCMVIYSGYSLKINDFVNTELYVHLPDIIGIRILIKNFWKSESGILITHTLPESQGL